MIRAVFAQSADQRIGRGAGECGHHTVVAAALGRGFRGPRLPRRLGHGASKVGNLRIDRHRCDGGSRRGRLVGRIRWQTTGGRQAGEGEIEAPPALVAIGLDDPPWGGSHPAIEIHLGDRSQQRLLLPSSAIEPLDQLAAGEGGFAQGPGIECVAHRIFRRENTALSHQVPTLLEIRAQRCTIGASLGLGGHLVVTLYEIGAKVVGACLTSPANRRHQGACHPQCDWENSRRGESFRHYRPPADSAAGALPTSKSGTQIGSARSRARDSSEPVATAAFPDARPSSNPRAQCW